ncbi:MAG: sigma-70 family RNA polymerase sigma factor [Clostridia bacterium]|nr:sigma-70 family RNA polymerase sigma factor [Clostridia bacterium]
MTDEQIVNLYWERSEQAIRETEKAYGRYFHHIARGILGDDEDAKEIVNDTYLKAWNSIPPERPNPLRAFLGRVTRQLAINRVELNSAQKRGGGEYVAVLDELGECISDGEEDMSSSLALREVLNQFLRSLPNEARRVFIKRYWYMLSIRDIAEEYGMSESRVKSQLMRTRQKLRIKLEHEGFDV